MFYKNKKKGEIYTVLTFDATNSTNEQDGERTVWYVNEEGELFNREFNQFNEKFERVSLK